MPLSESDSVLEDELLVLECFLEWPLCLDFLECFFLLSESDSVPDDELLVTDFFLERPLCLDFLECFFSFIFPTVR